MIYIDLSQELIKSISEYNMEIFINILRSENKIIECEKIIDDYRVINCYICEIMNDKNNNDGNKNNKIDNNDITKLVTNRDYSLRV